MRVTMDTKIILVFAFFMSFEKITYAKTAEEWKTRIIYQILTDRFAPSGDLPTKKCTNLRGWCGGTFKGIQNHLDYIAGLGANAIWISPIVLNTNGGYHGYWAKDIFKIESHFGSKEDLKSLVKACHERDIWVMVDVVANHMGYPPNADWTTPWNSTLFKNFPEHFTPFNKSEYYHPSHPYIKWPEECHDLKKIQTYWLANLADLNQSHPFVQETLLKWIEDIVNEYEFDGCRIDTVIQVPKWFWSKFQKAGKVFMLGEANNGPPPCGTINLTSGFQGHLDSVLNFPLFWTMRYILQERKENFTSLSKNLIESTKSYKDSSVLGGFIDNHDHERFLYKNPSYTALRNNLVYIFMSQCIPILYYGTEQGFNGGGDPNCRESLWPYMNPNYVLYKFIQNLIQVRKLQGKSWLNTPQIERHVDTQVYAFSRDNVLAVITTESKTTTKVLQCHPFQPGEEVQNLLDATQKFTLSDKGQLKVTLRDGEPLVLAKVKSTSIGFVLAPIAIINGMCCILVFCLLVFMNIC